MSSRPLAPAINPPPTSLSEPGGAPGFRARVLLPLRKPKHRRTKTGCTTCRVRKVKCDETRPLCNRCKTTGRKCEGYPEPDSDSTDTGVEVRRGFEKSASPLRIKPTDVPTINHDAEDVRFFDIFHTSAIPTIPGHTPMRTWKVLIPQLCVTEPAIAHAVLAISALHEEIEIHRRPLSDLTNTQDLSPTQTYAMKHYGRALKEVQRHLGGNPGSKIVVLVACIVFTAFESMRGQSSAAIAHIQSGNRIIQGLTPGSKEIDDPSKSTEVHSDSSSHDASGTDESTPQQGPRHLLQSQLPEMNTVAYSFVKMTNLIGSAEDQKGLPYPKITETLPSEMPECPLEFRTLDEARATLFTLLGTARLVLFYCLRLLGEGRTPGPDDGVPRCLFIDTQLQRWSFALNKLLRRSEAEAQGDASVPAESSEIVLLQLWRKLISVRLWTAVLTSQASLEALAPEFEEALNLAQRCLNLQIEQHAARQGRRDRRPPVFVMDMGVLPLLFFIGRQAPNRDIRLRALRLVDRAPRREALWDAEVVKAAIIKSLDDDERATLAGFATDVSESSSRARSCTSEL